MGRDLGRFAQFVPAWFENKCDSVTSTKPISLLIPTDFWPVSNKEQLKSAEIFIAEIATSLNVKPLRKSVANTWKETCPTDEPNLNKYFENVGPVKIGTKHC